MGFTDTELLLMINFIHFWTVGLIMPAVTTHVILSGANQFVIGVGFAGVCLCRNLAKDFLALFESSSSLAITLYVSFFCELSMATANYHMVFVVARCIISLVDGMEKCSKDFLTQLEPIENYDKFVRMSQFIKIAGQSCGQIVGGHIYYNFKNFELNALLAAISSLIGILLLQQMIQEDVYKRESKLTELPALYYYRLKGLSEIDYKANWDTIFVRVTYIISFTIFFNRFPLLLFHNYGADIVIIAYISAYQDVLLFAATHLTTYVKENFERFSIRAIQNYCVLTSAFALQGLYYAPSYSSYLVLYIPMIFTHAVVRNYMDDDLNRTEEHVFYEAIATVRPILHVITPLIVGLLYRKVGGTGFKILSIIPPTAVVINVVRNMYHNYADEPDERIRL